MRDYAAVILMFMGLLLAGCSGTPAADGSDGAGSGENIYLDDTALESFDADLRRLDTAIRRADVQAEKSIRAKISEGARRYQTALLSALHDDDSFKRRRLAGVLLGFTGDVAVVEPLLNQMQNEDEPESVRLNAVLGLSVLGGDKLKDYPKHERLMGLLAAQMSNSESSYAMRRTSVLAYSAAFDGALNDSLAPLENRFLSDGDVRVQIAAITALGDIGSVGSVENLILIGLAHPMPEIRAETAIALGKIPEADRIVPALADAANDESATVRREALDSIARHYGSNPELVYTTLVTALSDFDSTVRESATLGLATTADPRGIDALLQATGDRTAIVRRAAAESLGKLISLDDEKSASPLVALLSDHDPTVQRAAQLGLANVTRQDYGGDQDRWQKYYYTKYPDLDPANAFVGKPKPRIRSGIYNTGNRNTRSSSSRNTRSTRSSNTRSSRSSRRR